VAALVILVAEGHLAVFQGYKTVVGDGDAVGLAGQVREDMLGLPEGFLGIDHPLLVTQGREQLLPGGGLGKLPTATRQGQVALAIEVLQPRKVQPPKASREHAHRQEKVRPTGDPLSPVGRQAPRGQDTMQMGMMTTTLTIP